jgi:hypothetical protein
MRQASAAFELEADLEMFRCVELTRNHCQPGHASRAHWELGFGPVGGNVPIWGLYRFIGSERTASERELFWRSTPTRGDLLRWCALVIEVELAARLVDAVGALDSFYEGYFAARPDFGTSCSQVDLSDSDFVIRDERPGARGGPGSFWPDVPIERSATA